MNQETATISLEQSITLRDEVGAGFELAVGELSVEETQVRLGARVNPETWSRIVDLERFGLSDEVLPNGGPEHLDAERPVDLRLRLHAGMPEGSNIEELVSQLLSGQGVASEEDAWVICEAMQDVVLPEGLEGSAQAGFRTSWAQLSTEESELMQLTMHWLSEAGAEVQVVQPDLLRVPMEVDGTQWVLLVRVDAEARIVGVYSIFPTLVPEEALDVAAVFFMGQNFEIPFGAFEMDPEDGELRFRTAWAGGPEELPTGAQLYELIAPHAPIMSAHMEAFEQIISQS